MLKALILHQMERTRAEFIFDVVLFDILFAVIAVCTYMALKDDDCSPSPPPR